MKCTKNVKTETVATTTSDAGIDAYRSHPKKNPPVFHCFLKLPAEIRNQIYDNVAYFNKYDYLNLFSTSKQMRNEGAEVSARHCRFRLWLGWGNGFPKRHLPKATLDLKATAVMQNVFLMIRLSGGEDFWRCSQPRSLDYNLIGYFRRSQVMRESCQIFLEFGDKGYLSTTCASTTLFKTIRQLTSFRSVTIKISYDPIWKSDNHPMVNYIRNANLYAQRVKVALEPAWGPAIFAKERYEGGQKLLFHPFEWNSRIDQQSDPA